MCNPSCLSFIFSGTECHVGTDLLIITAGFTSGFLIHLIVSAIRYLTRDFTSDGMNSMPSISLTSLIVLVSTFALRNVWEAQSMWKKLIISPALNGTFFPILTIPFAIVFLQCLHLAEPLLE